MHARIYGSSEHGHLNIVLPKARTYADFGEFVSHVQEISSLPHFEPDEEHVILFPETPFTNEEGQDHPREEIAALQSALRGHPNFTVAYSKFNTKPAGKRTGAGHPTINNICYLVNARHVRAGAKAYPSGNETAQHWRQGGEAADYNADLQRTRFELRRENAEEGKRVFPSLRLAGKKVNLVACGDAQLIQPEPGAVNLITSNGLFISGNAAETDSITRIINDLLNGHRVFIPGLPVQNLQAIAHAADKARFSKYLARAHLRVHVLDE